MVPALLDVRCLDENETVWVGMSLWALLPPVTVLERVLTEEDGQKHRYVRGYLTIQVQVPGRTQVLMSRLKMGLHFHSHLLSRWKAPADFITISKDFDLSRLHGLFGANDAVELWHWNAHLLAVDTLLSGSPSALHVVFFSTSFTCLSSFSYMRGLSLAFSSLLSL